MNTRIFRRATALASVLGVALTALPGSAHAQTARVFTVAGGTLGGAASDAATDLPFTFGLGPVSAAPTGGFVVADWSRIWRVGPDGRARHIAGIRPGGYSGDGGPALAAQFNEIADVAAMPDGSILVADRANRRVRSISPSGTVTTLAGSEAAGTPGDGGPAPAATLAAPASVSPTADGGFLIADERDNRVRRVDQAGTITTVAGTGRARDRGDRVPAVLADLDGPRAVAAQPDGGFLIVTSSGLRRVSPAGTIETVLRRDTLTDVAVAANNTAYVADMYRDHVTRIAADGRPSVVVGGGRALPFGGDGQAATKLELDDPASLSVTAHGGLLISDSGSSPRWPPRVRLVTPAHGRLPFTLAILPATRVGRRQLDLRYRLTAPARVRLVLHRRGRVVADSARSAPAGRNRSRLRVRLKSGRAYELRITADAEGGQTATAHATAVADGLLKRPLARRAAQIYGDAYRIGRFQKLSIKRCRRFARGRIDCELRVPGGCEQSLAVILRRNGQLFTREYACSVQRRPRWRSPLDALWPL